LLLQEPSPVDHSPAPNQAQTIDLAAGNPQGGSLRSRPRPCRPVPL
jgi:hypothetical protein